MNCSHLHNSRSLISSNQVSQGFHSAAPESTGTWALSGMWSAWLKPYFVNTLLGALKRPGSPSACQTSALTDRPPISEGEAPKGLCTWRKSLFNDPYSGISIWSLRLKPKLSVWGLNKDGLAHPKTVLRRYKSTDSTAGTSIIHPRDGWGCALKTLTGGRHTAAFCTCARPLCLSQRAAANIISNFSELQLGKRTEETLER